MYFYGERYCAYDTRLNECVLMLSEPHAVVSEHCVQKRHACMALRARRST
jgi:hypothetical protein